MEQRTSPRPAPRPTPRAGERTRRVPKAPSPRDSEAVPRSTFYRSGTNYVPSLDGLRALCALGVVFYHMNLRWCQGGLIGVTVLFVLSGYLVTTGLLKEFAKDDTIHIGRYLVKRGWRLMPTAIVYTVVTAALCTLLNHALLTKMRPDIIPALLMVLNWAKIFAKESYFAAQGAPSPLTHFWSLAIEAQFYLIWPLLLLPMLKRKWSGKRVRGVLVLASLASAVLMALVYTPGEDPSRAYYGTDTRAMSLLIGAWLAFAWPFEERSRQTLTDLGRVGSFVRVLGPVSVVGLVVMMVVTNGYSSFSYYGGTLLCSVIAAGAIAGLVPRGGALSALLGSKPLEWVGKRSYAIYIWHYIILELLNRRNVTTAMPWWQIVAELALILAVSELSYRFVERPWRNGPPLRREDPKGGRARSSRRRPAVAELVRTHKVASVAGAAVLAVAVLGIAFVPPVTVAGNNPNDKVLTQAALKKPLEKGRYDVTLIGDSVSLGARDELSALYPHGLIDSQGSRQWSAALDAYKAYRDQGVVGDIVIFSVGTNGRLLDGDIDEIMSEVGADKQVWFVNLRAPSAAYDEYNAAIARAAERYKNVRVIDWHGATAGHDGYVGPDGIHLTAEGRHAFAQLVFDTVGYHTPTEEETTYAVTAVGDSVMLSAADALARKCPLWMIDAADVRNASDAAKTLGAYVEQGVVGPAVVVNVGCDGPIQKENLERLLELIGQDRTLYLVNERIASGWCADNNALLGEFAAAHDNVELVDWYAASAGHESYFEADGATLTPEGAEAYSDLLSSSVKTESAR